MDREARIKTYNEMIHLGDEMYECEMRTISRKTSKTFKDDKGKNIFTVVEVEEVSFS